MLTVNSVDDVEAALREHRYLPDIGISTVIYLALKLSRPLLLEGDPGVGKTEVAKVLADWIGGGLIRLQCYEGIDVSQAVYEWDYARQLLHLRTLEATGQIKKDAAKDTSTDELANQLYDERFLIRRPLLQALTTTTTAPPVLLVDEIDRADDEFEAFLLEVLSDYSITIPEVGTFTAATPPVVVITSNRTRDVHDALKRRCLYHWVSHPGPEREAEIIMLRAPEATQTLAQQVALAAKEIRNLGLYKPPGVAETIDWARALSLLGGTTLEQATFSATLGALLKYSEDHHRVQEHGTEKIIDKIRTEKIHEATGNVPANVPA